MSSQNNSNDIAEVEAQQEIPLPVAIPMPVRVTELERQAEAELEHQVAEIEYEAAFGEHSGISAKCRDDINNIKNNNEYDEFTLSPGDAAHFINFNLPWKLLGKYISNNTHLKRLELNECQITDERMASLFSGLVRSTIDNLLLYGNEIGIDGVRSM